MYLSLVCDGVIGLVTAATIPSRPNSKIDRGRKLTKMVSNSAGYNDPIPDQIYQDSPVSVHFAVYIGRHVPRRTVARLPLRSRR